MLKIRNTWYHNILLCPSTFLSSLLVSPLQNKYNTIFTFPSAFQTLFSTHWNAKWPATRWRSRTRISDTQPVVSYSSADSRQGIRMRQKLPMWILPLSWLIAGRTTISFARPTWRGLLCTPIKPLRRASNNSRGRTRTGRTICGRDEWSETNSTVSLSAFY